MAGLRARQGECLLRKEVEIMQRRILLVACLLASLAGSAHAVRPPQTPATTYVPFDRLIANVEAFIKADPYNPQGYYILARMHYFVFVDRIPFVLTENPDTSFPPKVAADWQVYPGRLLAQLRYEQAGELILAAWGYKDVVDVPAERWPEFQRAVLDKERELTEQGWKPEYLETAKVLAHAAAAVDNFERALDLDPENGLFYLSLASLYEQYSSYTTDANITDHPAQLACVTVPKIRLTYYLGYRFSIEEDSTWEYLPRWGLRSFVSYEAGSAYLRWAQREPSIADSNSVAQVKRALAELESLPVEGPITPIIFTIGGHESVLDLLAPDIHVTFDLDGTGGKAQWPWIKPGTGLLVWDPSNKGEITSGRQLFGSATWWLLFPNGYAALDALDDNRDGSLCGPELKGIGVWFDRNSNGRSEPGEVQPVTSFGVQAIRTRATRSDHGMPMNAQGLVLKDGTIVPTYDWVVSPITGRTK
jgi:tetratricopeptide (TPR) repeat protein